MTVASAAPSRCHRRKLRSLEAVSAAPPTGNAAHFCAAPNSVAERLSRAAAPRGRARQVSVSPSVSARLTRARNARRHVTELYGKFHLTVLQREIIWNIPKLISATWTSLCVNLCGLILTSKASLRASDVMIRLLINNSIHIQSEFEFVVLFYHLHFVIPKDLFENSLL